MELDSAEREQARTHTLSLESLATVYGRERTRGMVDHARAAFGLSPLSPEAVHAAFRSAIISGRAHRAHMGRDVYGSSNKDLWDLVCADFGDAVAAAFGPTLGAAAMPEAGACADPSAIALLHTLTEFDTSPTGRGHTACVAWLTARLTALGFTVEALGRDRGKPLVVAHREARGLAGHVVLYGHYDVTPFGAEQRWTHPPRELTVADGRLLARGVADNKGPLACRLAALAALESPALTWLIQGEEETGSAVAHALLPDVMRDLRPTLWLDETGYHDHQDGTLRLLGR
ncbi:MAG: M20/M25/M40 family metallo-hydrolase [Sandaracinaceae bacterium]|nr:M20/M25/M40 family metallo-hydrolase [Sandaracinaceae bacterium]